MTVLIRPSVPETKLTEVKRDLFDANKVMIWTEIQEGTATNFAGFSSIGMVRDGVIQYLRSVILVIYV